jgi:MFS family permease
VIGCASSEGAADIHGALWAALLADVWKQEWIMPGVTIRRPRRTDVGLLWSAASVSALGSAATTVVLPLVALESLGASVFEVGVIAALGQVSWLLFGLPSGVWADLLPRRITLVSCDLTRAAALASIPVTAVLHCLTIYQLCGVAFVVGTASVFFDVASQSFVPELVPDSELMSANSKISGGEQAAATAGPGVAGWIVQLVGAPPALLLDVASYLVSALCLWGIRGADRERPAEPRPAGGLVERVHAGLRFVWHDSILRPLMLMATSFNFFGAALGAVQVPFLLRTLHLRPGVVGLLMAVEAPGALLGTVVARRLADRLGTARTVAVCVVASPACAILMPVAGRGLGALWFAAGSAGCALFMVVSSILTRVYRQRFVPKEMLTRVTSVNRFVSWGALPIGSVLAGALSTAIGIRPAFLLLAVAMLLITPLPFFMSRLHATRELDSQPAAVGT